MSVNKVMLIGRLGAKPESKTLQGGAVVSNFSIATSESWKDKDGQKKERTEWHRVQTWGKLAELVAKYLDKGREVYVEGKLQTRSWEDNGVKKYATEIVAHTVQFLGSNPNAQQSGQSQPEAAPTGGSFTEDEIPF